MGSLIALLTIVVISLIIVRIGSQALMMTGLSWDTASFQSYSAFFGVGFLPAAAWSGLAIAYLFEAISETFGRAIPVPPAPRRDQF